MMARFEFFVAGFEWERFDEYQVTEAIFYAISSV